MKRKITLSAYLAGVCVAAFLTGEACAQAAKPEAAAPQADAGIADIIVTADRRERNLQDVAISVTAVTGKALETKQITDVLSLTKVVPGMQSKQAFSPADITIAIRGVTQLIPSPTIDPPIGIYIDGVYTATTNGANAATIDLERVEVLKGPQGTLFGRNTIGGALSITTAAPTDEFEGSIEGKVGNHDAWEGTAIVNVPVMAGVVDTRFVYQHSEHGGFGRNLTTGAPTATNNQDYARASARIRPADNVDIVLRGFYLTDKGYTPASQTAGNDSFFNGLYPALEGHPGDLLSNYANAPGAGFYDSFGNQADFFNLKQYGGSATLVVDVADGVTLKSITADSYTKYDTSVDIDGTPYKYLDLVSFPNITKQFSQEIQIYGDALDNRLTYIAGGYYFRGTGSRVGSPFVLAAFDGPQPFYKKSGGDFANTSLSAFAQLTYELTDGLKLTGGARYVRDKRKVRYTSPITNSVTNAFVRCDLAPAADATSAAACTYAASASFHYVPWTVGLDFKPNDQTLIYAKLSKGFRSGAFADRGPAALIPDGTLTPAQISAGNAGLTALIAPVAPESILSPEAGVKLDLLDRRLRINLAGFYSDYKNLQLTENVPNPNCPGCAVSSITKNSGEVHIYGGEAEITALIGKFQLDLSAGYAHPKYVKGVNVGLPVINVSKFNGAASGTLPIDTGAGTLTLNGTLSYRSNVQFFALDPTDNQALAPLVSQKGFAMLDGRIAYALNSLPLTIAVYGSNLTNKHYLVSGSRIPGLGILQNYPGDPRRFGASLKYSF